MFAVGFCVLRQVVICYSVIGVCLVVVVDFFASLGVIVCYYR